MTRISSLFVAIALLFEFGGMNVSDPPPAIPVEQTGVCRASGIGQAFLSDAGAQALPVPACDLAVWIGDASVSFFRAGERTPLVMFSGRNGSGTGFNVELVGIGADPAREATSGRCLRMGRFGVMCHAVFEQGGVRKGVALTFATPVAPAKPARAALE